MPVPVPGPASACLSRLSRLCLDRSRGAEKTPQLVSRLAVFCCNVVQKSQTMTVSAGSLLSLLLPSMTSLHRARFVIAESHLHMPHTHTAIHTQRNTHNTHASSHMQPPATILPGCADLGVGLMKVGAAGGHTSSERDEKKFSGAAGRGVGCGRAAERQSSL